MSNTRLREGEIFAPTHHLLHPPLFRRSLARTFSANRRWWRSAGFKVGRHVHAGTAAAPHDHQTRASGAINTPRGSRAPILTVPPQAFSSGLPSASPDGRCAHESQSSLPLACRHARFGPAGLHAAFLTRSSRRAPQTSRRSSRLIAQRASFQSDAASRIHSLPRRLRTEQRRPPRAGASTK